MFHFANNIRASACLCSFLIFSLARPSYFFISLVPSVFMLLLLLLLFLPLMLLFLLHFSFSRVKGYNTENGWHHLKSTQLYGSLCQIIESFIVKTIAWIICSCLFTHESNESSLFIECILFNMDIGRYHNLTISLTFLFHFPHLYNNKAQDARHHVVQKAIR